MKYSLQITKQLLEKVIKALQSAPNGSKFTALVQACGRVQTPSDAYAILQELRDFPCYKDHLPAFSSSETLEVLRGKLVETLAATYELSFPELKQRGR